VRIQAIKVRAHQLLNFFFPDKTWVLKYNSIIKLDFYSVAFIAVKKCFIFLNVKKIKADEMNFCTNNASPLDEWLNIPLRFWSFFVLVL